MSKILTIKAFLKALRNALLLNPHFYESVESTPANHRIAWIIVLLASVSHLLGSAIILLINRIPLFILPIALIIDGLSIIVGYYIWTFLVLKIGQWLKSAELNYKELLNPIGFAHAPQILNFLSLIPLLGRAIEFMLSVWSLLAVIVAVRQGLNLRTRSAALVCLIGWIPIQLIISSIVLFFTSIADTVRYTLPTY